MFIYLFLATEFQLLKSKKGFRSFCPHQESQLITKYTIISFAILYPPFCNTENRQKPFNITNVHMPILNEFLKIVQKNYVKLPVSGTIISIYKKSKIFHQNVMGVTVTTGL